MVRTDITFPEILSLAASNRQGNNMKEPAFHHRILVSSNTRPKYIIAPGTVGTSV